MSVIVKEDETGEDFDLEINMERGYAGIRVPLKQLDSLIDTMEKFIKTKSESKTETLKVTFFKESTEYFYVDYEGKVHVSFHLDNAETVLTALKQFRDRRLPVQMKLPHP